MKRGLVLEFTKMHGAGNDFIVIDNRFFLFSTDELADIARRFCRRHFGIGADGVLALEESRSMEEDYFMRYINADGSVGEMCGNGARCLARFAFEAGLDNTPLRFGTVAGSHRAYVDPTDLQSVRVVVPVPERIVPSFSNIDIEHRRLDLTFVAAGVPHAVWFVDEVEGLPVDRWGSIVRNHDDFVPTKGANVDFVQVAPDRDEAHHLNVRCYERGVERETMACGTGAVSSFAAASSLGLIDGTEATVTMPGGDLRVGFTDDRSGIFLEGPAVTVYRGTLEL